MNFATALADQFGPARTEAAVHAHTPAEQAELFHSLDGGSTELEVLNTLHALVLLFKPELVLETGSGMGYGTIALSSALKWNGRGHLHTTETDPGTAEWALSHLDSFDPELRQRVTMHQLDSRVFIKGWQGLPFDFVFFDSNVAFRHLEFQMMFDLGLLAERAVCCFHDTSRLRGETMHDFNPAMIAALDRASQGRQWLECDFSRGFRLIRLG